MNILRTLSLIALFLLCFPAGVFAHEVPSLYPVNAVALKFVQPNGKERIFLRTSMDNNYFEGNRGWCGKIRRAKAVVSKGSPSDFNSPIRYEFDDGVMTSVYKYGKKEDYNPPEMSEPFSNLFPDEESIRARVKEASKRDIWKGDGRFRIFSKNPNKTATVIAGLFLLSLVGAMANRSSKTYFILSCLCAVALATALFFTQSRGAFLGAICGAAVLAVSRWRKGVSWKWAVAVFAVISIAVTAAMCLNIGNRFTRDLFKTSGSNAVRVDIMKKAPMMMADAPRGWGLGNGGAAYCMWYRDDTVPNRTRTLLNSHLTWLVEFGWPSRFAYVFALSLILLLLLDLAWRRKNAFPLACTVSLFVSAWFNHVMEDWLCLILPVGAVAYGFWVLRKTSLLRLTAYASVAAAISCVTLFAILRIGERDSKKCMPRVQYDGCVTKLNGAEDTVPDIWVVGDEFVLGGWDFIGFEFRKAYQFNPDTPSIAYVERIGDLPSRVKKLVLAGRSCAAYIEKWKSGDREGLCVPEAMLMLSPSVQLTGFPADLEKMVRMRGVVGSLAARLAPEYAQTKPDWLRIAKGCRLYIPEWISIAVGF